MVLDNETLRLIAVGASVSANCQPCLEHNIEKALRNGASRQQIAEAIEVGRMVRQGAATKMDGFVVGLDNAVASGASVTGSGCECPSLKMQEGGKDG